MDCTPSCEIDPSICFEGSALKRVRPTNVSAWCSNYHQRLCARFAISPSKRTTSLSFTRLSALWTRSPIGATWSIDWSTAAAAAASVRQGRPLQKGDLGKRAWADVGIRESNPDTTTIIPGMRGMMAVDSSILGDDAFDQPTEFRCAGWSLIHSMGMEDRRYRGSPLLEDSHSSTVPW